MEERSFAALPGQTLYMHGARNDSRGYYDTFFTGNFLVGSGRQVYKDDGQGNTPAEAVVGKYYEVQKVWTERNYLTVGCCLLLREKESGEEIYYNPYLYPLSMDLFGLLREAEKIHRADIPLTCQTGRNRGRTNHNTTRRYGIPLRGCRFEDEQRRRIPAHGGRGRSSCGSLFHRWRRGV